MAEPALPFTRTHWTFTLICPPDAAQPLQADKERWKSKRPMLRYFTRTVDAVLYGKTDWYECLALGQTISCEVGKETYLLTGVNLELTLFPDAAMLTLSANVPGHMQQACNLNYEMSNVTAAHGQHNMVKVDGLDLKALIEGVLPQGFRLDEKYRRAFVLTYMEVDGVELPGGQSAEAIGLVEPWTSSEDLLPGACLTIQYQQYRSTRLILSRRGMAMFALTSPMARDHLRGYFSRQYRHMALLALYQHRVLQKMSEELKSVADFKKEGHKVAQIHKKMLQFTQQAWISEVTDAAYGQQIWLRLQSTLGTRELFTETAEQIEQINGYLGDANSRDMNWKVTVLTAIAFPVNILCTIYGSKIGIGWPYVMLLVIAPVIVLFIWGEPLYMEARQVWIQFLGRLRRANAGVSLKSGESAATRTVQR